MARPLLKRAVGLCLGAFLFAHSQPVFASPFSEEFKLDGLSVRLGAPVEVTAQLGWRMDWPHASYEPGWSFIHLTPSLERFPGGNLIATYALDPDTRENPVCASAFQISADGGAHWGRRYSLLMQHNPMIFIPEKDDSLLALASELMPGPDARTLVGTTYLFKDGGREMDVTPEGVRIVEWPWPTGFLKSGLAHENWLSTVTLMGSTLALPDRLLATSYGPRRVRPFDQKFTDLQDMLLSSADGGHTWRYFSTIATADPALVGEEHFEGPNEINLIRLADGDLMAVFRVGGGRRWHLRRAYSHDLGRTWTKPDILPAWSVRPILRRLSDGTIALATGRPGIFLWLSTDGRGARWQKVDLLAHHNAWAGNDPNLRIGDFTLAGRERQQTTSYTGLVEVSPNHLLLVYDRDPEREPAGPLDLSRVFVLPIEIERQPGAAGTRD